MLVKITYLDSLDDNEVLVVETRRLFFRRNSSKVLPQLTFYYHDLIKIKHARIHKRVKIVTYLPLLSVSGYASKLGAAFASQMKKC